MRNNLERPFLVLVLVVTAWLLLAATFPAGYVGGRLVEKEYYVTHVGLTITVPDGATAQWGAMINGSAGHVSTGAVWVTMGDGNQAAPVVSTPTAGVPTVGTYLDIGQSYAVPAGVKSIKLKTAFGLIAYVRVTLVY